jgi:hypothetical protein
MSIAPSTDQRPSFVSKLLALGGVLLSCAYLANLGMGAFGEIPDILPGVGNLDEVFFSGLLIMSLHRLGIQVIPGLPKFSDQPKRIEIDRPRD